MNSDYERLIDLKDVCARMLEAWNVTGVIINLDLAESIGGTSAGHKKQWAGVCVAWDDERMNYRIRILSGLPRERQIWILAHELRHVMQRLGRDLVGSCMWQGQRIDVKAYAYNDLPWEIDANQWADAHAADFYGQERPAIIISNGRSWGDIPWGK
jgi:hypothetical protein